jgi:hypothetical protein
MSNFHGQPRSDTNDFALKMGRKGSTSHMPTTGKPKRVTNEQRVQDLFKAVSSNSVGELASTGSLTSSYSAAMLC